MNIIYRIEHLANISKLEPICYIRRLLITSIILFLYSGLLIIM